MKKQYFIYFFSIVFSNLIHAGRYFPSNFEQSVLTASNKRFLQRFSTIELHGMHKKEQTRRLIDVQDLTKKTTLCTCPKINAAHEILLQRMHFPCIVPLFQSAFLKNNPAAVYQASTMSIILSPEFIKNSLPSIQLSTLLHELRHCQQHLSGINMNVESKTLSKKIEKDADRFAAHAMRCFICLQISAQHSSIERDPCGYFSASDYAPYLQRTLKNNQLCKAHQNIDLSKIDSKAIDTKIDLENPSLIDRIPEKIEPLAFFSRAPKA